MRIVLDTNVLLVSISDRSPHHWIYLGLTQRKYELCVTTEILLEYAEVIEQHMGTEVSESVQGAPQPAPTKVRTDLVQGGSRLPGYASIPLAAKPYPVLKP